jgi:hypothetical protein
MKISDLLDINIFNIDGEDYESTLKEDLEIDPSNPNEALVTQAKLLAMYGFAYEHALSYQKDLEAQLERKYAEIDADTRVTYARSHPQIKLTEKMVESIVKTNGSYIALNDQCRVAAATTGMLKAAYKAVEQRKDLIVTLSHNLRSEMKNSGILE